jgi:hypothetical protein
MMGWMCTHMSAGLFQKADVVQKENKILKGRVFKSEAKIQSLKVNREKEQTVAALEMNRLQTEVDNLKDHIMQQRMESKREQIESAKGYVEAINALKSYKIKIEKENATLIREKKEFSKEN